MARRRHPLRRPGDYVDGDFLAGAVTPGAPVGVAHVQHIARELRRALDSAGVGVSEVASRAGLHRGTIHDLLAGDVYPDVLTVARLEAELGARLWPPGQP